MHSHLIDQILNEIDEALGQESREKEKANDRNNQPNGVARDVKGEDSEEDRIP
jgi:hypothetical protein